MLTKEQIEEYPWLHGKELDFHIQAILNLPNRTLCYCRKYIPNGEYPLVRLRKVKGHYRICKVNGKFIRVDARYLLTEQLYNWLKSVRLLSGEEWPTELPF